MRHPKRCSPVSIAVAWYRSSQKAPFLFFLWLYSCPVCQKLNGFGNSFSVILSIHNQVNVIGRNNIIQNHQTESFLCLVKPLHPPEPPLFFFFLNKIYIF